MSFFSFLFKKKFPAASVRANLFEGPLTFSKAIFYLLCGALLVTVYALLIQLNNTLLVTAPARGGTLAEGVIGAPRFINPVLAATDTDRALTRLVFAGLMKEYGDGTLVPELARAYTVSPDGRTYTFELREKLSFHDKSPLTSSDVAFTIEKLQSPVLNPRGYASWQDIAVSTPNQSTVAIALLAPDEEFLSRMTVGVLSAAQWHDVADEAFIDPALNLAPVGAGAFALEHISYDPSSGAPRTISFSRNRHYALGAPLLSSLAVKVYDNQDTLFAALASDEIDLTFSLLPQTLLDAPLPSNIAITTIPETDSVELYRRSSEPALGNASLLAIINRYIDKAAIVATVENGYGIPLTHDAASSFSDDPSALSLDEAQEALIAIGYVVKNGVLTSKGGTQALLGIATENDPELLAVGRALSQQLAALGIVSQVQAFDRGTFRDELAGRAFALVLLADDAQLPSGYEQALPLYTSAHLAASGPRAHDIAQEMLDAPELRYATASAWHAQTDRVWKWLAKGSKEQE